MRISPPFTACTAYICITNTRQKPSRRICTEDRGGGPRCSAIGDLPSTLPARRRGFNRKPVAGRTHAWRRYRRRSWLVAAYVNGVKRSGIRSTLKHFPGNPVITGLPASQEARVPTTMQELRPYLAPFKAGTDAGAGAVSLSPAIFDTVTPPQSGSNSHDLIVQAEGERLPLERLQAASTASIEFQTNELASSMI